ncbi:hypothetical protein PL78_14395 [Yersinia entomophaga]|uniref:Uncharacterized protein n=1 Tax=Yersinia entomophaga TaxID=935293 RepID=A0ABM6BN33_YERET|nr:hypothetical protein PL78_14395 [Yersinia entomophaga]
MSALFVFPAYKFVLGIPSKERLFRGMTTANAEKTFAIQVEALMDDGFPLPTPPKNPQRYIKDSRLT